MACGKPASCSHLRLPSVRQYEHLAPHSSIAHAIPLVPRAQRPELLPPSCQTSMQRARECPRPLMVSADRMLGIPASTAPKVSTVGPLFRCMPRARMDDGAGMEMRRVYAAALYIQQQEVLGINPAAPERALSTVQHGWHCLSRIERHGQREYWDPYVSTVTGCHLPRGCD